MPLRNRLPQNNNTAVDMSTTSNYTKASVQCCHGKHMVANSRTLLSDHVYYIIHFCANEFFRINSLDRISACLTGSGILYLLQRHTSQAAVLRPILCPTETYTGLVDAEDVFIACNAHGKIGIYCIVLYRFIVTRKLASSALQHYTYLQLHSFVPSTLISEQTGSIYSFRNTMYAFY
jgi:hypothetical protein